jgi:hypothetical protein
MAATPACAFPHLAIEWIAIRGLPLVMLWGDGDGEASKEVSNYRKFSAAISVLLLFFAPLASHNAFAQQTSSQAATAVRKNLDDCFYSSVAEQLKSSRTTDYNLVSEIAFQACSTEEQAIALLLTTHNVQSETVAALLVKIKLDLKKSIRDIAANPNKYLK